MTTGKHYFVAVAAAILVGYSAVIVRESTRTTEHRRPVDRVREPTFDRRSGTLLPPSQ